MNVLLYSTSSEKNKLSKALGTALTKTGHLTEQISVISPVLRLAYDSAILSKNYAYIESFGRYYFIENMVTDNQEIVLSLHVDVLMTYKDAIKNSNSRIIRSQSNFDKFIPDEMIVNKTNTRTYQRKIGSGFTRQDKYLVLIGG